MRNPINHNKLLLQISSFLGIAYLLRNMYLCSLIQDSNNDYEYAK